MTEDSYTQEVMENREDVARSIYECNLYFRPAIQRT